MITAVDTSVLLDVLAPDPVFGPGSADALREAIRAGSLVACEVVWAETSAHFDDEAAVTDALGALTVEFAALTQAEAVAAGHAWRAYRRRGGTRTRVVADFLIGAHALGSADRLLTRDRGFYRRDFAALTVLDPTST